jgi:hypothetical protein
VAYLSAARTWAPQATSSLRWYRGLGSRSLQGPRTLEYHRKSTSCVLAVRHSSPLLDKVTKKVTTISYLGTDWLPPEKLTVSHLPRKLASLHGIWKMVTVLMNQNATEMHTCSISLHNFLEYLKENAR